MNLIAKFCGILLDISELDVDKVIISGILKPNRISREGIERFHGDCFCGLE